MGTRPEGGLYPCSTHNLQDPFHKLSHDAARGIAAAQPTSHLKVRNFISSFSITFWNDQLSLIAQFCAMTFDQPQPRPSYFTEAAAKVAFLQYYDQTLDELGVPYESLRIETTFGDTHLTICGPEDAPPIVLLSPELSCTPLLLHKLSTLLPHFRVFAIDLIGQPGKSAELRPSLMSEALGQWMHELLTRLRLRSVLLIGVSFGAFVALQALRLNPTVYRAAVLIAPLGMTPLPLAQIQVPALQRLEQNLQLRPLATESQQADTFLNYANIIRDQYRADLRQIPLVTKEQMAGITIPVATVVFQDDPYLSAGPGAQFLPQLFQNQLPPLIIPAKSIGPTGSVDCWAAIVTSIIAQYGK